MNERGNEMLKVIAGVSGMVVIMSAVEASSLAATVVFGVIGLAMLVYAVAGHME
jgi:hypothetical protein